MLAKLVGIRPEEQRATAVAFATLAAILAGHSLLETARDALFLEKLPAEHLPFAYMAIAVLALLVSKANQAVTARLPRRALLSGSLVLGGLVTAVFFQLTAGRGAWELGALYVWTGVLATVVVVQFWLQLGDVLDVGQAKRVFSLIAAGGLVGATLGSAAAGALLSVLDARELLLVSAGIFVFAALLPLGFGRTEAETPRRRRVAVPRRSGLREVISDPYLLRLFFMILVGAILVTGIDFLFKAKVVAEAENQGWHLGIFFARYYAVVNGIALVVQLLIAPRLLGAVGVNRALLLMPGLLLVGAVGFAATISLIPVLLLKGTDGALRHSVHRTASEILFLPLPRRVRERFKAFAEAVGQRGGQALASVLILAVTSLTSDASVISAGLAILAGVWVATMVGMQPHYLELFRKQLREGTVDTEIDIPDLDLASFETLLSALSSEDDTEVIAALEMFEMYGKTALVPALILYHPSREVVSRAFEMFSRSVRADVLRLTGRLLKHEDPDIRAAALRTLAAGGAEEDRLRQHLDDPSPAVRTTALVALVGSGAIAGGEAREKLRDLARGACAETQVALAQALRQLPAEDYAWLAEELARQHNPEVAPALARTLAARPHERHIPVLIRLLARREARAAAREALIALGEPAFDRLAAALDDRSLPAELRRHLPRTLSRFDGQRALEVLVYALSREQDERVSYKILRGLGRMRMNEPDLPVDRDLLFDLARRTLEHAITILHWRLIVGRVVTRQQEAMTRSAEMLVAFLEEKQHKALEQVFRMLHIIEPSEDFRVMFVALENGDSKSRANSRELVSHLVPSPLREAILAMVGDGGPRARLREARTFYDPPDRPRVEAVFARVREGTAGALSELSSLYASTLRDMLTDPSDALRAIVGYHVAELGLEELTDIIADAARTSDVLGEIVVSNPGIVMEPSHAR